MQNIASLLSLPTDGRAVNSVLGAKNSPGEGIQDVLPGQGHSFLKTLSSYLDGNSAPLRPVSGRSGLQWEDLVLQELPQDGNVLPTTDFSISELKAFLNDLVKELKNLDNANISHDQKLITENLAKQLTEIERLLQESSNGEDVRIPVWLANDIQHNIQALRESGLLTTQNPGATSQSQSSVLLANTHHAVQTPQSIDTGKPSGVQEDAKFNQLSNILQGLVESSQEQTRTKSEFGLTDLFRSPLSSNDTKSGDTFIGNITGLYNQMSSPAGDKTITSLPIHSAFNQSGWGDEVGERIRWMVNQNLQTAELRLNPPQLGPIEVKVTVQNDQMNIMFTAHHAAVRDALESAMPRLREMFGDNGLNLVNVDISQHSFSDQRRATQDSSENYRYAHSNEQNEDIAETALLGQRVSLHQGMVDYYA